MFAAQPTWCDKCGDFMWGFLTHAVKCESIIISFIFFSSTLNLSNKYNAMNKKYFRNIFNCNNFCL